MGGVNIGIMDVNRLVQVGWRASAQMRDRVDAWAAREEVSRNELITVLVEQGLNAMDRSAHIEPEAAVRDEVSGALAGAMAGALETPPDESKPIELAPAADWPVEQGDPWEQNTPTPRRHLHRFKKQIEGTVRYNKGHKLAMYECQCGERKEQRA